ncbi:putative amp-dependent synthetase ligase protein [Neofusicoccum parvum UCRNP2]|uniref:Putative amp-dependent synthetase ligase protein n=1 Tax=Botryosphaeria parva (strain UCR-NP2) TaxID=1287680 RepID=R1GDE8_BOTPV|nr:putative amp-dependent synthetase ligase protein [Neofusicoccum parvum UCRNP2]
MQASITRDDEERIWQWNANLPVAPENCIHDVFDEQLQSSRDTAAIDSWDGHFTYAELDELSTRLALHLRSRGAGTDAVIPICFEKSRWVVVCMLAVVKSGAAFATLDPAMPTERLASFVRSVQPRVMLVGAGLKDRFDGLGLDLVSNAPELCEAGPPGDATLPQVRPDDLAYVLFTSGSTGTPKVVLHCHRAAAANMRHATGYGPGSRVLQFASQAFGASIWEIFKTLGNGGCLVIPPARDRLGGIANFITKKQITRTFFTPSLLNLLKPEEVTCLQILTVGGEPVTEQLIQTWAHRVRLLEAFGMTEGVAIETKIDREGKKSREGQTLVGATWIVDADDPDKLAPIGVAGELLIESPTLCKSYLDNPEADASAFLEQPLWARKHGSGRAARLFRTGDLARYTEDGVVQIVGRKDTRVKLYGQRFELGEVEQVMAKSLPDGVSAAAELITPSGGSPMLVAFIHGSTVDFVSVIKDIREKMAAALPDYMVPRGFVKLAERPMNASGKLDRKKLPASQEVIDTDVKRKTRLGDALVKFMLIKDSSASAYRLVMRISHAQYDAVSVGEIWRALESAYWGDEIPQLSPFSHYVDKAAAATAASKADEFWKARMAGAPTSDIISHSRPPYSRIVDSAAAASVPVPDLRAQGLTTATAVLACWSIVLSQLCQQQEVVFGNIISGRHLNVQGVEQTIGPCMNTLPIRAKVDPQATFAELLQTIQDDYLQSLPFSHLGHRQLIQNSTSWPRWSRFSTIVNHISLDAATAAAPPFSSARALAAGLRCALDIHEPPHDKADLWLHSASAPGGDAVSLELRYSGRAFPRAWVEAVLAHFCAVFERLPAGEQMALLAGL